MVFKIAISEALYSSKKVEWETPQPIFAFMDKIWHFTLDVCALPENAKCAAYYTPEDDGLKQLWEGVCWMNPPYGRDIEKWMKKWWHDYAMKATYIIFIKGRLKFGNADASCPFPSCFVIFEKGKVDTGCYPLIGAVDRERMMKNG